MEASRDNSVGMFAERIQNAAFGMSRGTRRLKLADLQPVGDPSEPLLGHCVEVFADETDGAIGEADIQTGPT